jgi:hypothetical protein
MKNGDVIRVLCDFWLKREQRRLNFHEIVEIILCDEVNQINPGLVSGAPVLKKIIRSFERGYEVYTISVAQRLINEVIFRMPLHETDLNSWAMNRRLIIIDPVFESIRDPNNRLEYQVQKNLEYYEKFGWTTIGLSDGVLADKNLILTTNIRKLAPFAEFHNPQRNLYSTLSMKGDELPRIRSKSMQKLMDRGISRKGWNLNTAILDTPLNFEDQILVDNSLKKFSHTVTRRFIVYGDKVRVKKGDEVKFNDVLAFAGDGQPIRMNLRCDEAKVLRIRKDATTLDGNPTPIIIITVEGRRFLREGSKFSNCHGNKGVVKFVDLGVAIDPRTGKEEKIHVMISGKSIEKRKNFGQIPEMLVNALNPGNDPIVVEDKFWSEKINLKSKLKAAGLPEDGTRIIHTYCGEFQAIVGEMFWGVIKDPEDQYWDDEKTEITNNRELRTSGLKFSHVELKALVTRFGPANPINKEVLSYAQGVEILQDEIRIIKSCQGELPEGYPTVDAKNIGFVDTGSGIFHNLDEIKGTIVDDEYLPEGFILRLPCYFQAIVSKEDMDEFTLGTPQEVEDREGKEIYEYNTIFIPNALMRRCWRHGSGKWGLNTVGIHLNAIVSASRRFIHTQSSVDEMEIARAVSRYFLFVTRMMGTKRGELSMYGMAVRYPHSARATATLADNLPKDTIEIYREMAQKLGVKNGDVGLVERFPCLGFQSIRPQYIKVTTDPMCKYVIRASGNSLTSESLDFDGDTLFIASFHSPQAVDRLQQEMKNPNKLCKDAIESHNAKKIPEIREMTLDDFSISHFPEPNNEEHAMLVRRATGVKSHTGPVIALAYNLMRIVERNVPYTSLEEHVHLELLLDFLGNTVFKQKHGIKSLQEEATDAICTANVEEMVSLGFDRHPSQLLCDLIRKEAFSLGVKDLVSYHKFIKKVGGSKIINRIVREKNRVYFATRSKLGPFKLLDHLKSPAVDLPSHMLFNILRSQREKIEDKIDRLKADRMKVPDILTNPHMAKAYKELANYVDNVMAVGKNKSL